MITSLNGPRVSPVIDLGTLDSMGVGVYGPKEKTFPAQGNFRELHNQPSVMCSLMAKYAGAVYYQLIVVPHQKSILVSLDVPPGGEIHEEEFWKVIWAAWRAPLGKCIPPAYQLVLGQ